jgi:hypothetical protein
MTLFMQFTAWTNYAAMALAEAEVEEAQAESRMGFEEAQSMVALWTGDKTDRVTIARAQRNLNPKVQRAVQELLTAKATRKMTAVMFTNCERCAQLVSRELSRRIGRNDGERRAMRWSP